MARSATGRKHPARKQPYFPADAQCMPDNTHQEDPSPPIRKTRSGKVVKKSKRKAREGSSSDSDYDVSESEPPESDSVVLVTESNQSKRPKPNSKRKSKQPKKKCRQGKGPSTLTKTKQPETSAFDFTFQTSGPAFPAGPPARFPWNCILPAPNQPASALHSCFSKASDAQLKSILSWVGVPGAGKDRADLIKMCVAYAALIRKIPSTSANATAGPSAPSKQPAADRDVEVETHRSAGTPFKQVSTTVTEINTPSSLPRLNHAHDSVAPDSPRPHHSSNSAMRTHQSDHDQQTPW
ncbi:hypothetical protein PGT21_011884 [Puccinia graminis f. sp. tritici]|uniref:Uncharacterized protein n=1 Tax=Puccinia graminis f. sp. tritici TaxID=56615 RepID=A0A5B0QA86_PUCGR|nr:hypothetical protein PGT21_011884 [Puccinia graminis f. sp. tritici]